MNMGDNSFSSTLEALDELWLLEDGSTIAPTCEENHFDFSPFYLEQGTSVFAEKYSINNVGLQGNNFSSHIESSYDPHIFVEQDSNTIHHPRIPSVENLIANKLGEKENSTVTDYSSTTKGATEKDFSTKTREGKSKIKHLETDKKVVRIEVEEESLLKKQDHNAKERVRRMKLHGSYVALGSLLPISRTSKKRWTAPVIIDKVVEYVPELEKEIKELTIKKNSMLSVTEKRPLLSNKKTDISEVEAALTVSVNEIRMGEFILQICRKRDEANVFSNLLESIEDEGICIVSASTIHVCEERECYHIHIQTKMKESSSSATGGDYMAGLKEKVISRLS